MIPVTKRGELTSRGSVRRWKAELSIPSRTLLPCR